MIGDGNGARPDKRRRRREPRKATPRHLRNAALHYLGRYASSAKNLHIVLMRKVERSAHAHGTDREAGAAAVAALVVEFQELRLVDDRLYAEGRARTLFRRGRPIRAIRAALAAKGVADDDIDSALAEVTAGIAEPDLAAAALYARRRRLGPWRLADERPARRARDLAVLARAGFGYDAARRVVDAESAEDVEALAAGARA